jgi:hypothetical protein
MGKSNFLPVNLFLTDLYVGYRAFLCHSAGALSFSDVTDPSGIALDNGWVCAWGDYDGDGRLALVSRGLWHNETPGSGHRLRVRLRGTVSNAAAIGSVVTVTTADGLRRLRHVAGGTRTGVQRSWPSRLVEELADLAGGLLVRCSEQLDRVREIGPMTVLRKVGLPPLEGPGNP